VRPHDERAVRADRATTNDEQDDVTNTKHTGHGPRGAMRWVTAMAALLTTALVIAPSASAAFNDDFGLVPGSFGAFASNTTDPANPHNANPADPATQAGAHPAFMTTSFTLQSSTDGGGNAIPDGNVQDIDVGLPPGVVVNPQASPSCARGTLFGSVAAPGTNTCANDTQVGVVTPTLMYGGPGFPYPVPLYNLTPSPGAPAEFGFVVGSTAVVVTGGVDPADPALGGYQIGARVNHVSNAIPILATSLTLWGVPADPSHDAERGSCLLGGGSCPVDAPRQPFLTNASQCDGGPPVTTIAVTSWQGDPVSRASYDGSPVPTGCDRLPFAPTVSVAPDTDRAGAPAGLTVDVDVPSSDAPAGLATPPLRDLALQLPVGMTISPSVADGLGACSDEQFGLGTDTPTACPDSAKIGTATIDSPVLSEALSGSVYLGTQQSDDPMSGRMYRMFLVAEGEGVRIKLGGSIMADPQTGQLTTRFVNAPQLPFDHLRVQLKGGSRAALANPQTCGAQTASTTMTSWGGQTATASHSFTVTGCSDLGRFAPTLSAGMLSPVAGASSPFTLTLSRADGEQDISALDVTLPPGVLGRIGSVPLCAEADAAAGSCPLASQIGRAIVTSGVGTSPLDLPQPGKAPTAVDLAGPYKGAPYSLSIVVPAQAGPFDLGTVVVRAALFVDPVDAHVTLKSDPIPTILKGVPLGVQRINVTIDRAGFMVSPTSCAPADVAAQVTSSQGAVADAHDQLQVTDCPALDLAPKLALSLTGKGQTTDDKHPGLSAELAMPAGNANLKQMAVTLPLSMALDPDNSQSDSMCTFLAGRKTIPDCPASSIVGSATAVTPLLSTPLHGPVYFIKNERTDAKTGRQIKTYPTLAVVLQGSGITLVLRASTNVPDNAHLVTTFDSIPDAPVSDFKVNINGGKKGILVVSGANLCAATQVTKQAAVGQNGKTANANITMSTPCALGVVASSHSAGALQLTVGGIGAGKVSVSGKGLTKTTRTITTATTATLAPRLSAGVRSTLAHHHDVKARVTVAFTPKGTKKAKTIHKVLTIHGSR
jgi:hypothetical protein